MIIYRLQPTLYSSLHPNFIVHSYMIIVGPMVFCSVVELFLPTLNRTLVYFILYSILTVFHSFRGIKMCILRLILSFFRYE